MLEGIAPTLTGLGERRHTGSDTADLEIHVEDVVSHIEMDMVTTGALARIPERIASLVYLDAFVPEDGQSLVDLAPDAKAYFDKSAKAGQPVPPFPPGFFGVTDPAMVAFIEPRLLAQPWRTFYQPVKAQTRPPAVPTSYIICTGSGYHPTLFQGRRDEMQADPAVHLRTIDTSHHCMMTAVDETVAALLAG